MRYLRSYLFVFDSPNWVTNLLFIILCSLIPIIGPIVLIGYFFEVIESLLGRSSRGRDGSLEDDSEAITVEPLPDMRRARSVRAGASDAITAEPPVVLSEDEDTPALPYPDFKFDRFTEYLKGGIWPFLVNLIVNMPVGMFMVFVMYFGMIGLFFAGQRSGAAAAVGFCLLSLLYFLVLVAMAIVVKPLYLRAGLSKDFAAAFSLTFFRDFLSRVGKELFVAVFFVAVSGSLLMALGILACFVGMYPAMALLMYAQHHIDFQLYDLYLKRGGTPVVPRQTLERYTEERPD